MFLHSPEAVVIDLVVVEVIDIDGVALVIRLAVDKFISRGSLARAALLAKRRNLEAAG
jgi:hypothetical protein